MDPTLTQPKLSKMTIEKRPESMENRKLLRGVYRVGWVGFPNPFFTNRNLNSKGAETRSIPEEAPAFCASKVLSR